MKISIETSLLNLINDISDTRTFGNRNFNLQTPFIKFSINDFENTKE